jgi:AraC-like DNA-binding protein
MVAGNQLVAPRKSEFFACQECQHLIRKCLTRPLLRLFTQLTGQRLHVWWLNPVNGQEPGASPIQCPAARRRAGVNGRPPQCCQACWRRRWQSALSPAGPGRRFLGRCGATNFCACLRVDGVCPLALVLQARVASHSPASSRVRPESGAPFKVGRAGETVSPAAFQHAMALVRLILHDLALTAQARRAVNGLEQALRKLNHAGKEVARLRRELRRRLPGFPEAAAQPGAGSRAQKLVEVMLDYVQHHYQRPISLNDLALAMKKNACYLSALFSHTTGVTFHQYLEEIRLSQARALLRDPCNRVGEVARAAGYASPDAFRHAFKACEGLSPGAWRAGQ